MLGISVLALMAGWPTAMAHASDVEVGQQPSQYDGGRLPIHHYSAGSQGSSTDIEYSPGSGVQLLSTSQVPFRWTIDFDSSLRGRNMKSPNGAFCNKFKRTYLQNATTTPYIRITLKKDVLGPDPSYQTKRFKTDGTYHKKCWSGGHGANATYFFYYRVPAGAIGYDVRGKGRASPNP